MTRIFSTLAAVVTFSILASIGLGFWAMALDKDEFWKDISTTHFAMGLFTSIAILLVHSIIFIYFLGTGRLVKEIAIAYQMPDEPWPKRTRELKRTAFPAALFAMLIGIATVAAGAGRQVAGWHWSIHLTLAFVTLAVNLWAFRVEFRCVSANKSVMDEVFRDIDRIRAERGLCSNEEALRQEARS